MISKLTLTKILVLILTLLGLIFLLLNSPYFRVKNIKVNSTASCLDEGRIKNEASLIGIRIFKIDDEEIKKRFKKYRCIKDIAIYKSLPDSVELKVNERVAIAKLITHNVPFKKLDLTLIEATASTSSAQTDLAFDISTQSASFLVDKEGFIFAEDSQLKMEVVIHYADNTLKLGDTLGDLIGRGVMNVLEGLRSKDIKVSELRMIGYDLLLSGDISLLFNLKGDIGRQLASLQLLIDEAKINHKRIEKLDLRYDKPVVVYSPSNKN